MHSKRNALKSSQNHPPASPTSPVHGKIVFHETSPWCQKGWGPLLYMMMIIIIIIATDSSHPRIHAPLQCELAATPGKSWSHFLYPLESDWTSGFL